MLKGFVCLVLLSLSTPVFAEEALHPLEAQIPGEEQLVSIVQQGILFLQNQAAQTNAGRPMRGTHAKGVCASATLEIFNDNLKQNNLPVVGLYQYPGTYKTSVRFANAAGVKASDWDADVKSVSLKVELTGQAKLDHPTGVQDYSTNNTPAFSINDLREFANLFLPEGVQNTELAAKTRARGETDKALWQFEKFREITYHSNVAFAHGDSHAVKYIITQPCNDSFTRSTALDPANPNAYMQELKRHVREDEEKACFDLALQFLDAEKMEDENLGKLTPTEWVENSAITWPLEQTTVVNVGQLRLNNDVDFSEEQCDQLKFNVNSNTFKDQRGIGSINRGRTVAEKASAQVRTAE